jgi:hypothetical protein
MKFIQVTRTGQYTDLAVFGLPLSRLLLWTVLVAVLHRFVCVGLMFLGFVVGGLGFAPGHANAVLTCAQFWPFKQRSTFRSSFFTTLV